MDSSSESKAAPTVTSPPQSSISSQTGSRDKSDIELFSPGLPETNARYIIPTSPIQLEELLKHGYHPQLVLQPWPLTQHAQQQQQQSEYRDRMMENSSVDQHFLKKEKEQSEPDDTTKTIRADDDKEEKSFQVKTEPVDPDDDDDDDRTEQSNGHPEARSQEKQPEITSNQVKQRLQEFVLNKQQREAAVAGVPDTKMLKRWNLGSGDEETGDISPLTRTRSSNGDSNFPLRKTASEPNLKAKSKLRAKVSEHRSYLGGVVVPRRRERIGNRILKSATTGILYFHFVSIIAKSGQKCFTKLTLTVI